jgi:hypothetical protein
MSMKTSTAKQSLLTIIIETKGLDRNIDAAAIVGHLRALYREIEAGAPVPHNVIRAALSLMSFSNLPKSMDVSYKIGREFEKLGYDYTAAPDSADLAALLAAGDYLGIVHLTSGSYERDLWAAAMTAHYGPTGTHESWMGPDGTPNAACRALPDVARRMADARKRCANIIDWLGAREQRKAA